MANFSNSTTVEACDYRPLRRKSVSPKDTDDEFGFNPNGRPNSDLSPNKRIFRLKQSYSIGTLSCRSLNSEFALGELNLYINQHNLQAVSIQEHRLLHKNSDPDITSHDIGHSILFTASAYKITNNATLGVVGITVRKQILPLLTNIKKVDNRILIASFKGNPKTVLVSCYSPHNFAPLEEVEESYEQLGNLISTIPSHNNLIIGGDFNARIFGKFSYHSVANRNGKLFETFLQQHNLLAVNMLFQKPNRKLWTWGHLDGHLAQIDYILFRKCWRNSFNECQAHTSSATIGGDHNIVTAKVSLSLRARKSSTRKFLYWQTLCRDKDLATTIDNLISSKFDALPINQQTYTYFVSICNEVG